MGFRRNGVRVVCMGGTLEQEHEYNFGLDPVNTRRMLACAHSVTVIPVEPCFQAMLKLDEVTATISARGKITPVDRGVEGAVSFSIMRGWASTEAAEEFTHYVAKTIATGKVPLDLD